MWPELAGVAEPAIVFAKPERRLRIRAEGGHGFGAQKAVAPAFGDVDVDDDGSGSAQGGKGLATGDSEIRTSACELCPKVSGATAGGHHLGERGYVVRQDGVGNSEAGRLNFADGGEVRGRRRGVGRHDSER